MFDVKVEKKKISRYFLMIAVLQSRSLHPYKVPLLNLRILSGPNGCSRKKQNLICAGMHYNFQSLLRTRARLQVVNLIINVRSICFRGKCGRWLTIQPIFYRKKEETIKSNSRGSYTWTRHYWGRCFSFWVTLQKLSKTNHGSVLSNLTAFHYWQDISQRRERVT